MFEGHQIFLLRSGIDVLEKRSPGLLLADKACELTFVLGASWVTGGLQAIINPVAIR